MSTKIQIHRYRHDLEMDYAILHRNAVCRLKAASELQQWVDTHARPHTVLPGELASQLSDAARRYLHHAMALMERYYEVQDRISEHEREHPEWSLGAPVGGVGVIHPDRYRELLSIENRSADPDESAGLPSV
jgi:hypothetical protein